MKNIIFLDLWIHYGKYRTRIRRVTKRLVIIANTIGEALNNPLISAMKRDGWEVSMFWPEWK